MASSRWPLLSKCKNRLTIVHSSYVTASVPRYVPPDLGIAGFSDAQGAQEAQ